MHPASYKYPPLIDHPIEAFKTMPEGLDGYWWETETEVCVPVIFSSKPRAFLSFLGEIMGKGKYVFFPTVVSARLGALLKAKGFVAGLAELSPEEQEIYGQKYVEGLVWREGGNDDA